MVFARSSETQCMPHERSLLFLISRDRQNTNKKCSNFSFPPIEHKYYAGIVIRFPTPYRLSLLARSCRSIRNRLMMSKYSMIAARTYSCGLSLSMISHVSNKMYPEKTMHPSKA